MKQITKERISELLAQRLITVKPSNKYPTLSVVKYARRVFYDSLWTDELQEMRGTVIDENNLVVVLPFKKVFNFLENGTKIGRDVDCVYVRKINGFMAACTYVASIGQVVFSTTGSLDSEYAELAERVIRAQCNPDFFEDLKTVAGMTYLFEIVDESDPHIIEEKPGAYLIGARYIVFPDELNETQEYLDDIAADYGFLRPEWGVARFSEILTMSKKVKHEGFMVYPTSRYTWNLGLKLKSPYYTTTKFLARMKAARLEKLIDKRNVDEEFYPLIDYIVNKVGKENFIALDEQSRIKIVREFLED